jgi:hypothetical protein
VRSLKVGRVEIPGPELFWMSGWNEWFPLDFQVVLIEGEGITALVNTGPPQDLAPINDLWVQILGDRARMQRAPGEFITEALEKAGVAPDDVTHVFLTPLQLYTVANVALFRNASICIARRGWIHYHTTHAHPHDSRWHSIPRDVLVHLVTDAWDRVRLLEDEDEVAPGLRTWWAGTHHRASIAVEVATTEGQVVISDAFFYYENVEENRILGINENMYEALATYERARRADHRLPLYDPKVFDRYPGGIVAPVPAPGRTP